MAITNAQQYQQLVNPPMKGNKRPGYRGDDAARAASARGNMEGRADPGKAPRGEGPKTGAPSIEMINEIRRQNLEKAPDVKKEEPKFNVLDFIPGIGMARRIAGIFGPIDNREFFQQKVVPAGRLDTSKYKNFDDYMKARQAGLIDAYGNPIDQDNDNNIILPQTMMAETMFQAPSIMEEETLTPVQQALKERGDARRFVAEGGIMDLDAARQELFLGGVADAIGKGLKKVTRGIKKIAKSPIGKAALLYAGAGGLGNIAAGQGFFGGAMSNIFKPSTFLGNVGSIFSKSGLENIMAKARLGSFKTQGGGDLPMFEKNMLGKFLTSPGGMITAASLLPLFGIGTGDESEQEAEELLRGEGIDIAAIRANPDQYLARRFVAEGGIMRQQYQEGSKEPVAKKTMPLLDMGGMEKDYREDGGFVPIGRMEKADDVPARLSKNEFVFTADAVRNAGDGDIDKGAEVMYNMMKNLEAGGEVSEESQGLEGAREMFQTSRRLEEVL